MQFRASFFVLFLAFAFANCVEHHERVHYVERGPPGTRTEKVVEHHEEIHHFTRDVGEAPKFNMSHETKQALLVEKHENVFLKKHVDYFLKNPNTEMDNQCFAKLKPDQSIDFVIDLAPSPSLDKIDKVAAEETPFTLFLQPEMRTASRAYFGSVQRFIEAVTYNMNPECTHSIIYNEGRKYFICGRNYDDVESVQRLTSRVGEFSDKTRNLKTLWQVPTKEKVSELEVIKNNLGRLTKLALWNRDNGMPVVLHGDRHSRPIYTVVITDGWSGAKIHQLTDDLSRTTVIDVGNRRFLQNIDWNDLKLLAGAYSLMAPQQLPLMFDTIRVTACHCIEHSD